MWQGALDRGVTFTKTQRGKRIYGRRKETIERSFAEAKENHGLRYARMLGIANMREQCFLTAAVQNIKRLVASLRRVWLYIIPCIYTQMQGFVNGQGLSAIWRTALYDYALTATEPRVHAYQVANSMPATISSMRAP